MEKVDEAQPQNEYSPDYVKAKKENNFELLKQCKLYMILLL